MAANSACAWAFRWWGLPLTFMREHLQKTWAVFINIEHYIALNVGYENLVYGREIDDQFYRQGCFGWSFRVYFTLSLQSRLQRELYTNALCKY